MHAWPAYAARCSATLGSEPASSSINVMAEAKLSRTVFVRGISFTSTQQSLESAFGAIGPLRKCFLVQKKGSEQHSGYGYVQYALTEHAISAIKEFDNANLDGHKLRV